MISSIYRKIMVATDGSENVRKAVETAIEIAKISGAIISRPKAGKRPLMSKTWRKLKMLMSNPYFWKEILRMRLSILLKKTILTLLLRVHLEELEFKDSCLEVWLKM